MGDLRIGWLAICRIVFTVPVIIKVAEITNAVAVQVGLSGIEMQRTIVQDSEDPITVGVEGAVGWTGILQLQRAALPVTATTITILRAAGAVLGCPANSVTTIPAIRRAAIGILESLTQLVAALIAAILRTLVE